MAVMWTLGQKFLATQGESNRNGSLTDSSLELLLFSIQGLKGEHLLLFLPEMSLFSPFFFKFFFNDDTAVTNPKRSLRLTYVAASQTKQAPASSLIQPLLKTQQKIKKKRWSHIGHRHDAGGPRTSTKNTRVKMITDTRETPTTIQMFSWLCVWVYVCACVCDRTHPGGFLRRCIWGCGGRPGSSECVNVWSAHNL